MHVTVISTGYQGREISNVWRQILRVFESSSVQLALSLFNPIQTGRGEGGGAFDATPT